MRIQDVVNSAGRARAHSACLPAWWWQKGSRPRCLSKPASWSYLALRLLSRFKKQMHLDLGPLLYKISSNSRIRSTFMSFGSDMSSAMKILFLAKTAMTYGQCCGALVFGHLKGLHAADLRRQGHIMTEASQAVRPFRNRSNRKSRACYKGNLCKTGVSTGTRLG